MSDWKPVFVLPNVELTAAIEGSFAVLAPAHDSRVVTIAKEHATFRLFLHQFTDTFGVRIEPTVLLLRSNAPASFFDIGALASFRDLIAITAIGHNRARALNHSHNHGILFSHSFSFHPWIVDKHYEYLIGRTPAALGIHEVKNFRGQSSPELFRATLDSSALDEPLLRELIVRWHRRYESTTPEWTDIALFRSLNMAYHASLLPAANDATSYDFGRLISLWVSAFEILVHPGGDGQANLKKVFDLIEKVNWERKKCADQIYDTGGKIKIKRTLACWLYQMLYDCRNSFLHGNPVSASNLRLPISNQNLFDYAAPLYRLALEVFLPLVFDQKTPPLENEEEVDSFVAAKLAFFGPKRACEEAILTAVQAPEDINKKQTRRSRPNKPQS